MKINLFHHNAIIFPLVLLAVTSLKASTDSILENGNSSNNVKENIVKLAQIPAKELPSAPGTEQSITPKPVQSSQSTQSVQLDLLTSFTPPRAPAAVMNQRHFTIPFALTPSQNTGP
ncbi:MAG: hypothetical protein PHQ75_13335, partial [Thermoguttaceae bacterium]|nr:hypothetical protein [Thermoguttaceae bacterium]